MQEATFTRTTFVLARCMSSRGASELAWTIARTIASQSCTMRGVLSSFRNTRHVSWTTLAAFVRSPSCCSWSCALATQHVCRTKQEGLVNLQFICSQNFPQFSIMVCRPLSKTRRHIFYTRESRNIINRRFTNPPFLVAPKMASLLSRLYDIIQCIILLYI